MKAMKTTRLVLSAVLPLTAAILLTPHTALARDRDDRARRDHDRSFIGFRLASPWVGIWVNRPLLPAGYWAPGYYETRYEQVLVEPAHYETRYEQVLVEPGHYETRYFPALTDTLYDKHGRARQVVIRPAREERVWVSARYETRKVRVWVEARYETREVRVWVPGPWAARPPVYPWGGITLGGVFRF